MTSAQDPAITAYFQLQIDGLNLGLFHGCQGLSAQVETEERREGGNNDFVWRLPTRVVYSPVTLTRPLTEDTAKVARWFSSLATGIERPTAQIAALRPDLTVVARWGLLEVLPTNWTGPVLDPSNASVATETLELAHHGFTDAGGA